MSETQHAHVLKEAERLFLAGDMAGAEMQCQTVLRMVPDHSGALRQLGLLRLVAGDPAGALALLRPIAAQFPRDAFMATGLAEASWATESPSAAIPHFQHALSLTPNNLALRARLGSALLAVGQTEAAHAQVTQVLLARPDDAGATVTLGMALIAMRQNDSGIAALERAAGLDPADATAPFQLGQGLRKLGRIEPAIVALREAARRGPGLAYIWVALGDALLAQQAIAEARAALRRATELDAASVLAWTKRGEAEQAGGDLPVALLCYRSAIELTPGDAALHAILGNALLASGDVPGAQAALAQSMRCSPWMQAASGLRSYPASSPKLRVGILAAPGGSNTPTDYIIDRAKHDVTPIFMLPGFDYAKLSGAFDVFFNAVTDPDAAPDALQLACALPLDRPVIDPPGTMAETERAQMAAKLRGIPGLYVPGTIRVQRAALRDPPPGLHYPLLLRPVGTHGGGGVVKADDRDALAQAVAAEIADEVYVTVFADFQSSDGLYRKLRIVFVDGKPFPVHLAIGEGWLSHYFRTHMDQNAALRDEEAAFLRDPRTYLGPQAWAALDGIAQRVGLGYFGLDAALGADGQLILFECNATMLVRHVDRPAMFDYKREPAERIRDAMTALLIKEARHV